MGCMGWRSAHARGRTRGRCRQGGAPAGRGERGQITVEFAVVMPVILLVMVIAIDCMVFIGQCARFDNVVPQRIIALATSPASGEYELETRVSAVTTALEDDFSTLGQTVTVEYEQSDALLDGTVVFTCTLSMPPWPLGNAGATLFGTRIPLALTHECTFAIDPYTPGEL